MQFPHGVLFATGIDFRLNGTLRASQCTISDGWVKWFFISLPLNSELLCL
jgi:hypothetical protein